VISVDTSVVVRYLVGTPEEQSARAARLIDGHDDVGISLLVLAETAHVLRSFYRVPVPEIADKLIELVTRSNVLTLEISKPDVLDALARARAFGATPIVDALIAASARALGGVPVATFDRRFGRLGVGVFEPA
jgi:predicted nucleic acid-binding protein